jgi:hypothetical protein
MYYCEVLKSLIATTTQVIDFTSLAISTADVVTQNDGTGTLTDSAIVASGAGLVRHVCLCNTYAGSNTITVKFNNNGTKRQLISVMLAQGSVLFFDSEMGWYVIDSDGRQQTVTTATIAGREDRGGDDHFRQHRVKRGD